jgi:UDP-N-acetylmuramate dehydrogenase
VADRVMIRQHVPLAPLSTLGIGGPARWYAVASTPADVAAADAWCRDRGVELFALGGGSNLVIADEGLDRLVLRIEIDGVSMTPSGDSTSVRAGAGEPWDRLVGAVVDRGLAGVECLSGIPGSVGGTPIQNVGAYGQEVADTIDRVEVFDRATRTLTELRNRDCGFAYRMSRFKSSDAGRFIVTGVSFTLATGAAAATYPDIVRHLHASGTTAPTAADVRAAVLAVRRAKGMVLDAGDPDTRSVGSFFMNPVVSADTREHVARSAGVTPPGFALQDGRTKLPAAWLIERAGFGKGFVDGAVGTSTKHPLALINRGGATARDVLRLATRIKRQVLDRFGVALRPEPIFVGFDDDPDVTYLVTE